MFYYKKMVRYMPSSFVDLVFAGKRIKVGLRRGKFNYDASTSAGNRRTRTSGAKKKEGDARAVTTAHTSPSSQQTPHNPHVPISLAPIQLLGQYRISPLPDAPPTKNAQSTTKTSPASPTKSIPYTAQIECKSQPQYKHQPKEELPRKKTRRVHPNLDAVCRPTTILAQQPNGCHKPREGISTSLSLMVLS